MNSKECCSLEEEGRSDGHLVRRDEHALAISDGLLELGILVAYKLLVSAPAADAEVDVEVLVDDEGITETKTGTVSHTVFRFLEEGDTARTVVLELRIGAHPETGEGVPGPPAGTESKALLAELILVVRTPAEGPGVVVEFALQGPVAGNLILGAEVDRTENREVDDVRRESESAVVFVVMGVVFFSGDIVGSLLPGVAAEVVGHTEVDVGRESETIVFTERVALVAERAAVEEEAEAFVEAEVGDQTGTGSQALTQRVTAGSAGADQTDVAVGDDFQDTLGLSMYPRQSISLNVPSLIDIAILAMITETLNAISTYKLIFVLRANLSFFTKYTTRFAISKAPIRESKHTSSIPLVDSTLK